MNDNLTTRGIAFDKIIARIAADDRRVDEDIFLFDDYSVNPLMKKPMRTNYTIAINILKGKGSAMVNMANYSFEAPCLLVFLPGQVIQLTDDNDGIIKSRVMILSRHFMDEFYGKSLRINEIYSTLLVNPIIPLDRLGQNYMDNYVRSAILTATDINNPARFDVIMMLTVALFYGCVQSVCKRHDASDKAGASRISRDFLSLVRNNCRMEHRLEFYASSLCISLRYLFQCVKSVTGMSARYWLEFNLTSEAKVMLSDTSISIDEASRRLGFVSQSNFGKFFKRLTGETPSEYRRKQY